MANCKATVYLGKENICKNCIKADVCKVVEEFKKEPVDGMYIEGCEHFKDRSKFVELPSDNLPVKVYLSDDIDRSYVLRDYYYVKDSGILMMIINCIETQKSSTRKLNEYHKTVFLTREEAEQVLRERENNDRKCN